MFDQITKHQFAKDIGVHIRDLRIVEKSPANRIEAAINPRTNTIILSIANIKLAIFHDEVVIFCPDEVVSQVQHQFSLLVHHVMIFPVLLCVFSQIVPRFVEAIQQHISNHETQK